MPQQCPCSVSRSPTYIRTYSQRVRAEFSNDFDFGSNFAAIWWLTAAGQSLRAFTPAPCAGAIYIRTYAGSVLGGDWEGLSLLVGRCC